MKNKRLRSDWMMHMRHMNFSDETIDGYVRGFTHFMNAIGKDLSKVGAKDLKKYFDNFRVGRHQNTVNKRIAILSSFYRWMHETDRIVQDLRVHLPKVIKVRRVLRDVPTVAQVKKIILTPDVNTLYGYRNRTMMLTIYSGGLRRSELINLDLDDVDYVSETIWVNRKGGDRQQVPIGSLAMEYLSTYIDEIRPQQHPKGPWVFTSSKGWRVSGLTNLAKKIMRQAGYENFNTHSLRHAAATHMTKNGADIRAVQYFLGHKDIGSTSIYTRIEPTQIRDVIDRMEL